MSRDEILDQMTVAADAGDNELAAQLWEAHRIGLSADERDAEDEELDEACDEACAERANLREWIRDRLEQLDRLN